MDELRLFKITIEVTMLSSAKEALQVVVDGLVNLPSIEKIDHRLRTYSMWKS